MERGIVERHETKALLVTVLEEKRSLRSYTKRELIYLWKESW
jgi:hypothetical protein